MRTARRAPIRAEWTGTPSAPKNVALSALDDDWAVRDGALADWTSSWLLATRPVVSQGRITPRRAEGDESVTVLLQAKRPVLQQAAVDVVLGDLGWARKRPSGW